MLQRDGAVPRRRWVSSSVSLVREVRFLWCVTAIEVVSVALSAFRPSSGLEHSNRVWAAFRHINGLSIIA